MFVRRLKLRPPQLLPLWMKRVRLEQRLSPDVRVVSIVAGPGYGKTVLAARLYSTWSGPRFWYSLDAADADLAVLASHLDTGIRALGIDLPEFDASNAGALGSPKEIGSRFAEGLVESPQPALLVFDDVHVLEKSRSLAALDELIKRGCQANVYFVLSGRSMPVALGTVAAAAQLATMTAADLAFSDDETLTYLRLAVREKVSDALVRLAARAEGWAAGLTLIASSARKAVSGAGKSDALGSNEDSLPPASSDEMRHYLFDYLASEVLTDLTNEERQFLLDTSILEQLEVELCDAVAGISGSRELLAAFTDRGLFVARRSDDAYTYHQLFREFLRHNLSRARPAEEITALHERAGAAFMARGDARQAISHYLEAGNVDAAVRSLESRALDMLRLVLSPQSTAFSDASAQSAFGPARFFSLFLGACSESAANGITHFKRSSLQYRRRASGNSTTSWRSGTDVRSNPRLARQIRAFARHAGRGAVAQPATSGVKPVESADDAGRRPHGSGRTR